jgi:exosortase
LKVDKQSDGRRILYFAIWLVISMALFIKPCIELFRFSRTDPNASHIIIVPLICLWLIYLEKKKVLQHISYDNILGTIILIFSVLTFLLARTFAATWPRANVLAVYALSLVLVWISGFALFFGRDAFKNARFPLFLLLFSIPLPDTLLNPIIYFLQKGSADVAEMIFDLTSVPAMRDGFVFHLAHVNIEVAKECSGIRSSLALIILALIVGHLFLRTFWKQAVFVFAGVLVMIIKNGVRIATLTILAQYVDPSFLYGRLHHDGGVVFFLLGLLLLLPILWTLQRSDKPTNRVLASSATD